MEPKKIIKLYKYRTGIEHAESFFNQNVHLGALGKFNDPFEGRIDFVPPCPPFVLAHPELLAHVLDCYRYKGESELTKEEVIERLKSQEFLNAWKGSPFSLYTSEIFPDYGALCLTVRNDNIPMWAYYGNDHKGCCIEFELDFSSVQECMRLSDCEIEDYIKGFNEGRDILSFKSNIDSSQFVFGLIHYQDIMPRFNFEEFFQLKTGYEKREYYFKNSFGVKFIEWAHEREFRLITRNNSTESGLLSLKAYVPFLKVSGVIMGSRMEAQDEEKIHLLCSKHQMNLYKASCIESAYKISITSCDIKERNLLLQNATSDAEEEPAIVES